jgi:hypothetical protein
MIHITRAAKSGHYTMPSTIPGTLVIIQRDGPLHRNRWRLYTSDNGYSLYTRTLREALQWAAWLRLIGDDKFESAVLQPDNRPGRAG